jgi:acyl-CoA reductase-like NAD-dependent aldehyde dehydrogenase
MSAKLTCAARAFESWRNVPLDERITRVANCLRYFELHRNGIAVEITRQMGKPLNEARAEVDTMLDRARASIALAEEALTPTLLPDKPGYIRRIEHRPKGVVLAITNWNYPLLIPINVIVPGLLAGNTILLKHSSLTWLTGCKFTAAFAELGEGLVTDLVVEHSQIARLFADKRIAHVTFTGSTGTGREVYQTVAASRLIDVGMELSGKGAAYVAEDCDLEATVPQVVDGALYNAGQSRAAVERVYVHRSRYQEFLERAEVEMERYVIGDPLDDSTTLGPMALRQSLHRLEDQVLDATDRGADLRTGGELFGPFFRPTLLADVSQGARIMHEETFGPILPVASVDSDEQALAYIDDSLYGLSASIWTQDGERAERFARALEVGTVFQNMCDYLDPALPWSGARGSGKGTTMSQSGFFHLTRRKSINFRVKP